MNPINDKEYLIALGARIREIRKSKSLTMEELSNELDIEYRQLGRIERGEINTSVISLLKIAHCLNVPMSDFFKF